MLYLLVFEFSIVIVNYVKGLGLFYDLCPYPYLWSTKRNEDVFWQIGADMNSTLRLATYIGFSDLNRVNKNWSLNQAGTETLPRAVAPPP